MFDQATFENKKAELFQVANKLKDKVTQYENAMEKYEKYNQDEYSWKDKTIRLFLPKEIRTRVAIKSYDPIGYIGTFCTVVGVFTLLLGIPATVASAMSPVLKGICILLEIVVGVLLFLLGTAIELSRVRGYPKKGKAGKALISGGITQQEYNDIIGESTFKTLRQEIAKEYKTEYLPVYKTFKSFCEKNGLMNETGASETLKNAKYIKEYFQVFYACERTTEMNSEIAKRWGKLAIDLTKPIIGIAGAMFVISLGVAVATMNAVSSAGLSTETVKTKWVNVDQYGNEI